MLAMGLATAVAFPVVVCVTAMLAHFLSLVREAAHGRHMLLHDRLALRFGDTNVGFDQHVIAVPPLARHDMLMLVVHVNRAVHDANVATVPVGFAEEEAVRYEYRRRRPGTPEHRAVMRPPPWPVHHVWIVVAYVDDLRARLYHDGLALLIHRILVGGHQLAGRLRAP